MVRRIKVEASSSLNRGMDNFGLCLVAGCDADGALLFPLSASPLELLVVVGCEAEMDGEPFSGLSLCGRLDWKKLKDEKRPELRGFSAGAGPSPV